MTTSFFVLFFVASICQSCSAFEGKPKYFRTSFKSFIGAVTRNTSNVVNLERFVFLNWSRQHHQREREEKKKENYFNKRINAIEKKHRKTVLFPLP